jgi:hypothetical protein
MVETRLQNEEFLGKGTGSGQLDRRGTSPRTVLGVDRIREWAGLRKKSKWELWLRGTEPQFAQRETDDGGLVDGDRQVEIWWKCGLKLTPIL